MNAEESVNVLLIIKKLKAKLGDVMNLPLLELIKKPIVNPINSRASKRKKKPSSWIPTAVYWNNQMGRHKVKVARIQRNRAFLSRQLVSFSAIRVDCSHFQVAYINPMKTIADVKTYPKKNTLLIENPHKKGPLPSDKWEISMVAPINRIAERMITPTRITKGRFTKLFPVVISSETINNFLN
jgi:hypothetical protein